MNTNISPSGLAGRAIAVVGAAVIGVSLTQPIVDSGPSFWQALQRGQYLILSVAALVIILVLFSLATAAGYVLLGAALAGSLVLGYFLLTWVQFENLGRGWVIGIAGSAIVIVGAVVALGPILSTTRAPAADLAFLPPDAQPVQPQPIQEAASPAPQTVSPTAGWYEDPSDPTRLRYWDGQEWNDQTREALLEGGGA